MASGNSISFMVMEINPNVENKIFRTKPLKAAPSETIAHLRKLSAESFNKCSNSIQLIYFGKVLDDDWTFETAGIREGSTILVYPKISRSPKARRDKHVIKAEIFKGILQLYKMKGLHMLGRAEFLEKIYLDMPELDPSTFALLQTSHLFVRCLLPHYPDALDVIAEKHPLLGEVLSKAIEWAPELLEIIPPEHPNMFTMDMLSDESENDSAEENSVTNERSILSNSTSDNSSTTSSNPRSSESWGQPQPGPSSEPQPGTSQSRSVTVPMLQAALQAAYSRPGSVGSQTFKLQLAVLRSMGFTDQEACIEALVKSGGDIDLAVSILFKD